LISFDQSAYKLFFMYIYIYIYIHWQIAGAANRFHWGKDETTKFCKLCVQMIEKGDLDKEQPSLNDEAAISLSRELAGTLGQEIPIKKLPRQMEE
jgi:hypothetical protein